MKNVYNVPEAGGGGVIEAAGPDAGPAALGLSVGCLELVRIEAIDFNL